MKPHIKCRTEIPHRALVMLALPVEVDDVAVQSPCERDVQAGVM